MASKQNKIGLTRITLTPRAALVVCIVGAILIVGLLAACAVSDSGGGGHGGSGGHGSGDSSGGNISDDDDYSTKDGSLFIDNKGTATITIVGIDEDTVADYVVDGVYTFVTYYYSSAGATNDKYPTTMGNGTDAVITAEQMETFGIVAVVIPDTVTEIADGAFDGLVLTLADGTVLDATDASALAGQTVYLAAA